MNHYLKWICTIQSMNRHNDRFESMHIAYHSFNLQILLLFNMNYNESNESRCIESTIKHKKPLFRTSRFVCSTTQKCVTLVTYSLFVRWSTTTQKLHKRKMVSYSSKSCSKRLQLVLSTWSTQFRRRCRFQNCGKAPKSLSGAYNFVLTPQL